MNKKILLLAVIGVVVLGGGAAAAWLFLGGEDEEAAEQVAADIPAGLIKLDTFVINLNEPGNDRFVKVAVQLTVAPEERATEVAGNELLVARIRDRILTLLAAKNVEELSSPLGKETLKREIKSRTDPLLEGDEIQDVLFSEFVVQ